jgi:tRNA 2-thiouridine synthesizing protein D
LFTGLFFSFCFIIAAMSQSIAILVIASPTGQSSTQTALEFAKTVVASGRHIEQVFFYHEAVALASDLTIYAQDEFNLPKAWQAFISENQIAASVCIASSLKRGIIDEAEAKRYNKTSANISPHIDIAGLGTWITAVNNADKSIVFAG